jgi:modulator of FtsH protease HflC
MDRRLTILGVLAFAVLVILFNTIFIVEQREQAIVLRFGEPVRVINQPGKPAAGLNLKFPFWENVVKFDRRNLALESAEEEILTADRRRLVVDAFVRYRISDPLAFYQTVRDERTANDRIEQLVNSSLRQVLGSAASTDIVSGRRAQLLQLTRVDVAKRAQSSRLGIEIIDVRIRRADLPSENEAAVYRRMQTSRQQVAAEIRAQGEQQKREIIAGADKEVAITLATARQTAGQTMGEGDALRTRIFAQSFGKDPSFAAFFRSMQAYEQSFQEGQTTLVLSPDSAFFKYFDRGPSGR